MLNFSDQCLDLATLILEHNLDSIQEDGTIAPQPNEAMLPCEPGHAALAIGEFFRATGKTQLGKIDLIDLAARCITAQTFMSPQSDNGLAFASLAIISFGPEKSRNPVWARLMEQTQQALETALAQDSTTGPNAHAFNIAKSVARACLGFSKKDETGKLIDDFLAHIDQTSSHKYCDSDTSGIGGNFDLSGVLSFVIIRQALQLHSNITLRERKLPSLRTYAEKYLKLIIDLVRIDGLGWAFGQDTGAYSQMLCISLILQALRDGWITSDKKNLYFDTLRKLFFFFFKTYLDQEHGFIIIRDEHRNAADTQTTRMANFDGARYLAQWSRLAKSIGEDIPTESTGAKTSGKFICFDKTSRKEQGIFVYQNANTGLLLQLPLIKSKNSDSSHSLSFPHAPGVFDWPSNKYLPIMTPELSIGGQTILPSFYGKRCTTGLGPRKSFVFKYEQPDLINKNQEFVNGLGSCKVQWTFADDQIACEYAFTFKEQVTLDAIRYVLALSSPHPTHSIGSGLTLGPESLRACVTHDDFQSAWLEPEIVASDPQYSTPYSKIQFLQTLERSRPLILKPGQPYKLALQFNPDITLIDAL